jgi:hypothetical protein
MSTSPTEKTLPHGTQPGAPHRSTSQARCGDAIAALLRLTVKCIPAARNADGSAGMWPPLVRTARMFSRSPAAIGGMPGSRKLTAATARKRANEHSQRITPIRSDVRHGSTLIGNATSWIAIAR